MDPLGQVWPNHRFMKSRAPRLYWLFGHHSIIFGYLDLDPLGKGERKEAAKRPSQAFFQGPWPVALEALIMPRTSGYETLGAEIPEHDGILGSPGYCLST